MKVNGKIVDKMVEGRIEIFQGNVPAGAALYRDPRYRFVRHRDHCKWETYPLTFCQVRNGKTQKRNFAEEVMAQVGK